MARQNLFVQDLHAKLEPEFFRGDTKRQELEEQFRARLAEPGHQIALAEIDGAVAGYLLFEFQERPMTGFSHARRRLYVHHLSVDPAFRRRGVASALMAFVEREGRAAGYANLLLDTWASNRSAVAFFQAIGFEPMSLVMRNELSSTE